MRFLEALADAFINTFGITQPAQNQRRRAALFIFVMMLLTIAIVSASHDLSRLITTQFFHEATTAIQHIERCFSHRFTFKAKIDKKDVFPWTPGDGSRFDLGQVHAGSCQTVQRINQRARPVLDCKRKRVKFSRWSSTLASSTSPP